MCTNVYYRCDWLQWQLDWLQWLFDYLDSLIALTASLHCYDSLTAMTAWLLWQLDCYDSLNAMTAWSQLFEKWFGTDLTLEMLSHLKRVQSYREKHNNFGCIIWDYDNYYDDNCVVCDANGVIVEGNGGKNGLGKFEPNIMNCVGCTYVDWSNWIQMKLNNLWLVSFHANNTYDKIWLWFFLWLQKSYVE